MSDTGHPTDRHETPARAPVRPPASPSTALQVIETVETVLTALMLAFIFRAFLVEAFIIPTGSMAHSLLGAHATRTCPTCGWEFDYEVDGQPLCPNCHQRLADEHPVRKDGDRILVHKWPFAIGGFLAPRRWDVIVFRSPANPSENFIKRLVGLPGETLEVVDGDLYIDGRIQRKPQAVQSVLWFVVFDQGHFPEGDAASPRWLCETAPEDVGGGWTGNQTRIIHYGGTDAVERRLRFAPADVRYFQDVYAYNRGPTLEDTPFVGDMRMEAEVVFDGGDGAMQWVIVHDGTRFTAELHRDGELSLTMGRGLRGEAHNVDSTNVPRFVAGRPYLVEFGHLDYRVYLSVDGEERLTTRDTDYTPPDIARRHMRRTAPLDLSIAANSLEFELRGLRVDRDVYYTERAGYARRGTAGLPFVLRDDEYFVLGDNSPGSRDSREWTEAGPHLPAGYRPGTVRGDQIVGPAALVYLPGLLPIDAAGRWRLPDVGSVRFVR
ncbi:MAG: signal peptidase I [Phycisphaerae bacterium]